MIIRLNGADTPAERALALGAVEDYIVAYYGASPAGSYHAVVFTTPSNVVFVHRTTTGAVSCTVRRRAVNGAG